MSVELQRKAVETPPYVANDLGEFSAFAATYDVDRVKDRIRVRGVREHDRPVAGIGQAGAGRLGAPRRGHERDRLR